MSVEGGPFKRDATESVVYKWIRRVIYSQDIIEGIENFCNISFNKSHQHSDSTDARIDRDDIDVKLLVDFFIQHNHFPDTDAIISIATGMTGDKDINCYNAFEQGLTVAAVAEWYRYRTVACFVTDSSPVPLKTRRVGQRCPLNLSRAETSSRWCGVVW
ncbi:uncharacterized protein TNCV_1698081 [Trichonephila clavipes]|nr:uncharacterized protein TNCV_1698081 [Trichonephila clavipes]